MLVFIGLLGLCFGSFINALVWRVHQLSSGKKLSKAKKQQLSILHGRSMCPSCKHELRATDLVPVLSWLYLRGKCRYCKASIGWQYPLVEVVTAILFVVSYMFWPYALAGQGLFTFIVWLSVLVGLIALAIYDLRWMLLPNVIVFTLFAVMVAHAAVVATVFGGGANYVIDVIASMAVAGGLFYILFQVSGGKWIGGGDVKLGWVLGLILANPITSAVMLFVASVLGTVGAVLPAVSGKKISATAKIPFGPYLIAATFICLLWGSSLVNWYTGLFAF